MEQSEESDQDQMDLHTSMEAEKELCGSFEINDELDYEDDLKEDSETGEGEVSSDSENEESDEEDPVVSQCIKERNIDKLKKILKKREEACKKLQKDLQKENCTRSRSKRYTAFYENSVQ